MGSVHRLIRWPETRIGVGVLQEKGMRRLLASQLASISGDFLVIAVLPFAVFAMGGSGAEVGVAFGVGALLAVLVFLFGGVGGRLQRRLALITADGLLFVSQAMPAILLIFGIAELWQLLLVQVVQERSRSLTLATATSE